MGSVDASMEQPEQKNISHSNSNLHCTHCPAGKGPGNPGCLEEIHKKVVFSFETFFNIFKELEKLHIQNLKLERF